MCTIGKQIRFRAEPTATGKWEPSKHRANSTNRWKTPCFLRVKRPTHRETMGPFTAQLPADIVQPQKSSRQLDNRTNVHRFDSTSICFSASAFCAAKPA